MMQPTKGCLWILLGFQVFGVIALLAYVTRSSKWCNHSLDAGDCQLFDIDGTCFCVDTTNTGQEKSIDLYAYAESKCQNRSGYLATPQQPELLLWLSKRLFSMGVDRALIALRKKLGASKKPQFAAVCFYRERVDKVGCFVTHHGDGEWYWMKGEIEQKAQEILWRPDVPPRSNQSHAVVTVESIEMGDYYDYVLYNYDYYIENDKSYQWYGITTSDNNPDHLHGIYYICHYTEEPKKISKDTNASTSVPSTDKENPDCKCDNNKKVHLTELDSNQSFLSPRYPKNYCSDLNCRWIITTDKDLVIKVQLGVFSLEKNMDYLYVFDGETDDSPLIQSCTGTKCDDRMSTGPAMQIHFSSDHVITNIGFKFTVSAIQKDECYCSELVSISLINVGDSFAVSSPNYPNGYCEDINCKWLINAPTGSGIELHWEQFGTEPDADFVTLYDGNQIDNVFIDKCSGKTCSSFTSSDTQVLLHFVSNDRSTTDPGFRFIVRAVKNYCKITEALFKGGVIPAGVITSSKSPRIDGYIPHGAVITFMCPQHHKIANTIGQLTDSTTCVSPLWSNLLAVECIPVCDLDFSIDYVLDDVHFCRFGENEATQLVPKGDEITISRYDYANGNKLIEKIKYTCVGAGEWNVQPPVCHPMGILLLGGSDDSGSRSIEFYSPAGTNKTSELLDLELLVPRKGHSAVVIPSGELLVISSHYYLEIDDSPRVVERIDIENSKVTYGPSVSLAVGGRAAVIGDTVYLCGGYLGFVFSMHFENPFKVCEVLKNGEWSTGVPMLVGRYHFVMVSVGQSLYAIGNGINMDDHSAETYSVQEQRWKFIAPMIHGGRQSAARGAAVLEGIIYVCGAHFEKSFCESYSPQTDHWQALSSLVGESLVPSLEAQLSLVAFDGHLYAFFGQTWVRGSYAFVETVHMFDVATDSWTSVGKTRKTRADSAAVMIPYDDEIPSKDNRSLLMINSEHNHILNITALGSRIVMTQNGVPVFNQEGGFGGESANCKCETKTIELVSLEESAAIESPGFPEHYCNYHRCLWTISTVDSSHTDLTVSLRWEAFSVENQMDMVYIYDEIGLLEVCTGSHCSSHKSRGNMLHVYFESDHVTVDIGFKAQLIAINADACYCPELRQVHLSSRSQSFALESPNYPQSYCTNHHCGWHIFVEEDLLLRINWKTFHLGEGHALDIHLGAHGQVGALLDSCTNTNCDDLQSSKNQLYLVFSSNDHVSSDGNAFSALVTAVHSYCQKIDVAIGSLSYDRAPRLDGNLTDGTVATLACPNGYKISDTLHDINATNTCVAPHWNQTFKTCVQVCKVDSTFYSIGHTNVCTYAGDVHTDLVPVGDELLVQEYDILADTKHSEQVFFCSESGWTPQTPTCHRTAILMYGNINAESGIFPAENRMLLYYPQEHRADVLEFMLESLHGILHPSYMARIFFMPSTLDDGRVLVTGLVADSSLLDLSSGSLSTASGPLAPRGMGGSARLAGEVVVCGGMGHTALRNCEVWRNDRWMSLNADMNVPRTQFAMVASEDTLFAMGGMDVYWLGLDSVEQYLPQSNHWQLVAPLPVPVFDAGAVHYNGLILLCGGTANEGYNYMSSDRCYKYLISDDCWQSIASMHHKRAQFSMAVIAGRIYAIGGLYTGLDSYDASVLSVETYDYQLNQWSVQEELPKTIKKAISPSTIVAVSWENKALWIF